MDLNSVLKLAPGCRLHPSQPVLLVPEGTLNLAGPARDILGHLDGKQSVAVIIEKLLVEYAGAPKDQLTQDVLSLLERMEQRGVIRT